MSDISRLASVEFYQSYNHIYSDSPPLAGHAERKPRSNRRDAAVYLQESRAAATQRPQHPSESGSVRVPRKIRLRSSPTQLCVLMCDPQRSGNESYISGATAKSFRGLQERRVPVTERQLATKLRPLVFSLLLGHDICASKSKSLN